jgi:hypothetical protein
VIGFIDALFTQLGTTGNYTSITDLHGVQRYTRTRILSLHQPNPSNGFITASLSHQITHEVFFTPPNSFLAIILQLPIPKTRLNSIPLLPSSYLSRLTSPNSTHFFSAELFLINNLHGPPRKHSLSIFGKACLQHRCIETEVTRLWLAYSLPRKMLTMNVYSDFTIPAFRRHVTIFSSSSYNWLLTNCRTFRSNYFWSLRSTAGMRPFLWKERL